MWEFFINNLIWCKGDEIARKWCSIPCSCFNIYNSQKKYMKNCTKTMHNTSCVPGTDSWTRTSAVPSAWIAPAITLRRVGARLGIETFCLDKVVSDTAPKGGSRKHPLLLNLTEKREHNRFGAPMGWTTKWVATWRKSTLSSPRAKRAGPKGLRAESARAVTGRRNSHRWEGGRLFEPSAGFFYGNSCNSGTESRKIVSKVGN